MRPAHDDVHGGPGLFAPPGHVRLALRRRERVQVRDRLRHAARERRVRRPDQHHRHAGGLELRALLLQVRVADLHAAGLRAARGERVGLRVLVRGRLDAAAGLRASVVHCCGRRRDLRPSSPDGFTGGRLRLVHRRRGPAAAAGRPPTGRARRPRADHDGDSGRGGVYADQDRRAVRRTEVPPRRRRGARDGRGPARLRRGLRQRRNPRRRRYAEPDGGHFTKGHVLFTEYGLAGRRHDAARARRGLWSGYARHPWRRNLLRRRRDERFLFNVRHGRRGHGLEERFC